MMKNKIVVSALILILLIGLGFFFIPAVNVLSVSSRKNPSSKVYFKTSGYSQFVISYTHSVNKGRVHDYYSWDKHGTLTMEQTKFVSYGAGIPEPEETPGATFYVAPDGYYIEGINRKMETLTMAVGLIAKHTIRFDKTDDWEGEEIPLKKYFEPQTSLKLKIKKVSLASYIFNKNN